MQTTLAQVVPADLHDNGPLGSVVTIAEEWGETPVYVARRGGEITSVAFNINTLGGYSGAITLMMGVRRDGTILGLRVIVHTETPGLGDKIETANSNWILAFEGRSLITPQPGAGG
jgi:electron transport complex protein RnfG